jgi:phosphoglycerate dehydrogenase-like enzyme
VEGKWLKSGQRVEVEIGPLGRLRNWVTRVNGAALTFVISVKKRIEGALADVEFCYGTLPMEWLPLAPRLRLIQQGGVGYVDSFIRAARERGVPVAITPEGTCLGVAEHTILLILAVHKHLAEAHATMRAGKWDHDRLRRDSYFFYGKTLGIVGLGRIGTDVAKRARGFEPARILYHDLFRKPPEVERALGVERRALAGEPAQNVVRPYQEVVSAAP